MGSEFDGAGNDGRKIPRISLSAQAKILRPSMADLYYHVETRQLGLGGCMISGKESLGQGSLFTLLLDLDGQEISIIGRVVNEFACDGRKHSCARFVHVFPEDKESLDAYIKRRTPPQLPGGLPDCGHSARSA